MGTVYSFVVSAVNYVMAMVQGGQELRCEPYCEIIEVKELY